MRAHKLTHPNETEIKSFDWVPGFHCKKCKEYKGLACEHNFEDDDGRVFEIMYCSFCGDIFEETDVTEAYSDRALALRDEAEDEI